MVFVGLQPFGGERESVLADERRYGNGNPVGAWALMAGAVARRNASAQPNGPVMRWRGAIAVLPKQATPL